MPFPKGIVGVSAQEHDGAGHVGMVGNAGGLEWIEECRTADRDRVRHVDLITDRTNI
jgi:hypothetical protein